MPQRTISIEHNGVQYSGEVMRIKATSLGWEDHGILTAFLHCEFPGGGIGVGGFCLDTPKKDSEGHHLGREGTAYGLDHVMQLMRTVGVSTWEDLVGKDVIVLHEGTGSSLGRMSKGIAGLLNDRVMILSEHAAQWHEAVTP